jgi:hypothetical protein
VARSAEVRSTEQRILSRAMAGYGGAAVVAANGDQGRTGAARRRPDDVAELQEARGSGQRRASGKEVWVVARSPAFSSRRRRRGRWHVG